MVEVTLNEQQKESLGLSPELINQLATANPLARKSLMNRIVSKFKESLMDKARLTDDPVERKKLQESVDESVKAARKVIREEVKTRGKDARAQKSGLFHLKIKCNELVKKGAVLATITDPYGKMKFNVIAPNKGYVINVNQAPIVHQGDAIFHMSTKDDKTQEEEMENIDE